MRELFGLNVMPKIIEVDDFAVVKRTWKERILEIFSESIFKKEKVIDNPHAPPHGQFWQLPDGTLISRRSDAAGLRAVITSNVHSQPTGENKNG